MKTSQADDDDNVVIMMTDIITVIFAIAITITTNIDSRTMKSATVKPM